MQCPQRTALALVPELDIHVRPTTPPPSARTSEMRLRIPALRAPEFELAAAPVEPERAPGAPDVETEEEVPALATATTTRPVPLPGAAPIITGALAEVGSGKLSRSAIYLFLCLDGAPSLEWAFDASALCPRVAYAALDELLKHRLVELP